MEVAPAELDQANEAGRLLFARPFVFIKGCVRFDDLPPGVYRVRVAASNFLPGGPLFGHISSTPTATAFATPDNDLDKGADETHPDVTGVTSGPVTGHR